MDELITSISSDSYRLSRSKRQICDKCGCCFYPLSRNYIETTCPDMGIKNKYYVCSNSCKKSIKQNLFFIEERPKIQRVKSSLSLERISNDELDFFSKSTPDLSKLNLKRDKLTSRSSPNIKCYY